MCLTTLLLYTMLCVILSRICPKIYSSVIP
nr:MAG TPA: hypothetical protein [Caudoviricetes sp.]